jgi:threonine aldolase
VGVDVLSFGATKNGTMYADAVVFFNDACAEDFKLRLKRGGHALSKTRFLAAQLLAYIEGDRWLANARHANEVARAIAAVLRRVPTTEILHLVDGNIIFAALDAATVRGLGAAGLELRSKGRLDDGRELFRLVTSFRSDPAEAIRLGKILAA